MRGRKRHILVDTEGLVLKAKVMSAKVPDQDGITLLLKGVGDRLPRLSHLWVDAGYQGRGKDRAEKVLGLSVEVVHRTPKPTPEKVAIDVGGGVVKRGLANRLAEVDSAPGLRGPPAPLGCGAHLLVALSEQEDEQRLREALRHS